jgi:hypothetical protein
MSEPVYTHLVKRSPMAASRLLTIDPNYLELEGPLTNTRFTKEDIEGFRFGISQMSYLFIPFSRTYNLEIKNSQGKIMRIRMNSLFNIGNKGLSDLFTQIQDQIFEAYFKDMANHYAQLIHGNLSYELAGVLLTSEGVLIKKDKPPIPWNKIGLQSYYHSCAIYDITDPKQYRSFDYWHDWNAILLRAVVDFKLQGEINKIVRKLNR